MAEPNTPKKRPDKIQKDEHLASKADLIREAKRNIKATTKMTLGELRKGLRGPTQSTRNYDKTSLRHGHNLRKVEKVARRFEKPFLLQLDQLLMQNIPYEVMIKKIKKITRDSERTAVGYKDALEHSIKMLAGSKVQLKPSDYALMSSVIDRVSELYSKNHDIGTMMIHIRQGTINKAEWDVICSKIKQFPNSQKLNADMDNIDLSVTALFFKIMDQSQRLQAVKEFAKRYTNDEAIQLADSLTRSGAFNIKQYEALLQHLKKDPTFRLTEKQTKEYQEAQEIQRATMRGVNAKLKSGLYINGAERILNRKGIAGMLITGIGVMGMLTNYLSSMNSGKGVGKFVAGFKNPYFILSAGIAAGGVHISQKARLAGAHGVGLFDRMLRPRSARNPFGESKESVTKNDYFTELTNITKNHRIIENWLLYNQGFDDMSLFLAEKDLDKRKIDASAFEPENKPKASGENLLEQFKKFQIGRGNAAGARKIAAAEQVYGKAKTQKMLVRLFMISSACEIQTSKKFKSRKVPGQLFTYHALLRDRQGVQSLPHKHRPEVRAKAVAKVEAAKAKAAKAKNKKIK